MSTSEFTGNPDDQATVAAILSGIDTGDLARFEFPKNHEIDALLDVEFSDKPHGKPPSNSGFAPSYYEPHTKIFAEPTFNLASDLEQAPPPYDASHEIFTGLHSFIRENEFFVHDDSVGFEWNTTGDPLAMFQSPATANNFAPAIDDVQSTSPEPQARSVMGRIFNGIKNLFSKLRPTWAGTKAAAANIATSATVGGGIRYAFNASARAIDNTGLIATLGAGLSTAGATAANDLRKAYNASSAPTKKEKLNEACRSLSTREHGKKYLIRFGTGAAFGFASQWGINHLFPVEEKITNFLNLNTTSPPSDIYLPTPTVNVEVNDILLNITLNKHAENVLEQAIKGAVWAQNQAAEGMVHGTGGFTKNYELAAEFAKNAASTGNRLALKNLAFMSWNGIGMERNTELAMNIVRKIGESWKGGEQVLEQAMATGPGIN